EVTHSKLQTQQVEHAPRETCRQRERQPNGAGNRARSAHAAAPAGRASRRLIDSARSRNCAASSADTSCSPYQARSNTATLAANRARASGKERARRRSSVSYSRLVLPG